MRVLAILVHCKYLFLSGFFFIFFIFSSPVAPAFNVRFRLYFFFKIIIMFYNVQIITKTMNISQIT